MQKRIETIIAFSRKIFEFLSRLPLKVWFIILPAGAVMGLVFMIGLEQYTTSQPGFCLGCHYWQAQTDFTKASLVHKKLRCSSCHAKRTAFVPRDYSAHPDRVDPNCRRCHSDILEKADTQGFKFNKLEINISHKLHLNRTGADCTTCHSNVYHGKEIHATNRPRMTACTSCHDAGKEDCFKCHKKGSIALPKAERVARVECVRCHHWFETKKIRIYGIEFSHEKHLAKKVECNQCHSNVEKHGAIIRAKKDCMNCHHRAVKAKCVECHVLEAAFRKGAAMGEKTPETGPMSALDCSYCHTAIGEGKAHSLAAVKSSCVQCHDETLAGMVDVWQQGLELSIKALKSKLEKARKEILGLPGDSAARALGLWKEAEEIYMLVLKDRSKGVHNIVYNEKLINDANSKIREIEGLVERK